MRPSTAVAPKKTWSTTFCQICLDKNCKLTGKHSVWAILDLNLPRRQCQKLTTSKCQCRSLVCLVECLWIRLIRCKYQTPSTKTSTHTTKTTSSKWTSMTALWFTMLRIRHLMMTKSINLSNNWRVRILSHPKKESIKNSLETSTEKDYWLIKIRKSILICCKELSKRNKTKIKQLVTALYSLKMVSGTHNLFSQI